MLALKDLDSACTPPLVRYYLPLSDAFVVAAVDMDSCYYLTRFAVFELAVDMGRLSVPELLFDRVAEPVGVTHLDFVLYFSFVRPNGMKHGPQALSCSSAGYYSSCN